MEDNKQSNNLVTKNFTKTPNWFFDELPKCGEPAFICVVGFLIRQFIGWQFRKDLKVSLKELSEKTGIHSKAASRWLNVVAALDWIEYEPAVNGGGKSIVRFKRLPEDPVEIRILAAAIRLTATLSQLEMGRRTHPKTDTRPRERNEGFCLLLLNAFRHIYECGGCETCLRTPELEALQDSIKRNVVLPPFLVPYSKPF